MAEEKAVREAYEQHVPPGTSRAAVPAMSLRSVLALLPLLCVACADETPSAGTADSTASSEIGTTNDAGDSGAGDVGIPFTSYGAADFESFHWSWVGTGPTGAFDMNADCGVTSEGKLSYTDPRIDAAGTATAAECDEFKAYVVSAPYLGALASPGDACTGYSDDAVWIHIAIRDGGAFNGGGDGCHVGAFAGAESRMRALREKYAIKPDSG